MSNKTTLQEHNDRLRGIIDTVNDLPDVGGDTDIEDSLVTKSVVNYVNDRITKIGTGAFYQCKSLEKADFGNVTAINNTAFYSADKFETLILRSNTRATIGTSNVFSSTKIAKGTGYIYVPASLVDSYKSATTWSNYAEQIRAIEDYPEITGRA